MKKLRKSLIGVLISSAIIFSGPAQAQKKYDDGASDTEIRIGNTSPLSGPASSFATISKATEAYMKMVNDNGGVNGRKINFIVYDDGYQPPKTVEMTRRLVESDKVLFLAGSMGTPTQLAVQGYLNQRKIPQLFLAALASKLADPKKAPWTMFYGVAYEREGNVYAKHVIETKPQAKIAVLYQDDDAGRAVFSGFKAGLGASVSNIVATQTYAVTDPSVDSQIVSLKASGADTVVLITIPKTSAQAIRKIHALGWQPTMYASSAAASIKSALVPAGVENSKGLISAAFRMSPADKLYEDKQEIKDYKAFMLKYLPGADITDENYGIGYDIAAVTVHVIKSAGDTLTRENIMKQAANLKGFKPPLALGGITMNTTPTDYFAIKTLQPVQFNGESLRPVGNPVTIE